MIQRLKTWWQERQRARRWRNATPAHHMRVMIEILKHSEPMRREFREAMYGKSNEFHNHTRGEKNGRKS